jgi:HSP20 family molecular chaperone IbpA
MKFCLFVLITFSLAQPQGPQDPVLKRLEQQLQRSQHMFEKFFKDDFFKGMDQQFQNHPFFRGNDLIEDDWGRGLGGIKTSWKDVENAKVLIINGNISGEDPLDIQVKNGMISIKGIVKKEVQQNGKKSHHQYQFQRSYSVPRGADIAKMSIEKKNDSEIWLIFPYGDDSNAPVKKKDDGLKPLKSHKSDPTI